MNNFVAQNFQSNAFGDESGPRSSAFAGQISRRDFIREVFAGAAIVGLCGAPSLSSGAEKPVCPPIVVFSKIYQELRLSYEEAAELTAEAGLKGIDCPVRPGGEVLPERVADDLPRYHEALRKHGLKVPLLTTAITSPSSPHAEQILKTAKKVGAEFYRLGFVYRKKSLPVSEQVKQFKSQLTELTAVNRELRIGALVQNHSPSGNNQYLAGDLSEMEQMLEGLAPDQIGAAFDIGHAIIVHGDDWRRHFEALKSHLRVAYIKDADRQHRWVPFGEGAISRTGYFKLLKEIGYKAPFSLHIEFDWDDGGKSRNRASLLKALKQSATVLRRWFEEA